MSAPKYTPGPWVARWWKETECLVGREKESPFCMAGVIAKGRGFSNEEVEANAHLIAAAPELLEALHNVLSCAEVEILKYSGLWAQVRAAIAKAEGRSTP